VELCIILRWTSVRGKGNIATLYYIEAEKCSWQGNIATLYYIEAEKCSWQGKHRYFVLY
jgi:hypothetical protein